VPAVQVPDPLHVSAPLHTFPSPQDAPDASGVCETPPAGSHESAVHGLPSSTLTCVPLAHVPPWHESAVVQALPSVQAVPFGTAGLEHRPLAASHVPAAWHWSAAEHATGFEPVQVPTWHESVCVQALPSVQTVPFGTAGLEHAPLAGSHAPAL
jgi:hypothetical protein